ncbi:MAG: hypothetical protein SXA11_13055 [Cyanobacteriota bacterium]|nr:hypothetical protein [Cyanobacteriota bacterium]
MSYSKFALEEVLNNFNLTLIEKLGKFNNLPEVAPSPHLKETLKDNIPLAVANASEKARSEFIVDQF